MARRDNILVSRSLYQIGVLTLITAIAWVGVGIYYASGKEQKVNVDQSVLTPINPTLDRGVVNALSGRQKVEVDLSILPVSTESGTR